MQHWSQHGGIKKNRVAKIYKYRRADQIPDMIAETQYTIDTDLTSGRRTVNRLHGRM